MSITVASLTDTLQTLFTSGADRLAEQTGFVRRTRLITGAAFAPTLVFGWLHHPQATLDELADTLAVRPQSLHDRFQPAARDFLHRLLTHALDHVFAATPARRCLLRKFTAVSAEDCTVLPLPADAADRGPGCGGNQARVGRAALKVFTRWELTTGTLTTLTLAPGKQPDVVAGQAAADPPPGTLLLADMGFFDLTRLGRWNTLGVSWITRIPARTTLRHGEPRHSIAAFLATQTQDILDVPIHLGAADVPARLVARRCPEAVRLRRLARVTETARRKQTPVSDEQRQMCGWTVFASNVPVTVLNAVEVWMVYRLRWQIELLFKGWKSQGGVACSRGRRGVRVECAVVAKLLGQVVCQWAMLLRGGPLLGVNQVAARRHVQRRADAVRLGLTQGILVSVLNQLSRSLHRIAVTKRRGSARQLVSRRHLAT